MKVVRRPLLTCVAKSQRNNFMKFNSRTNMLVKHGRLYSALVKGFKVVLNVSVSGLRCFIEFSRGVSILPVNDAAVAALEHSRNYVIPVWLYRYRTVQICYRFSCSSMFWWPWQPGIDLQLQKAILFSDTHTHSSCHYAGADCDPTPSQIRIRIAACALVLHQFEPSFRWLCKYSMTNHTIHGAHYNLKLYWSWHQFVLSILLGIKDWYSIAVVLQKTS